eukprot:g12038.t1 g12038   contig6:1093284-1094442(-)
MASSASNTSVRLGQSSNEDMSSSASSSTPPVTSPDVLDRECQQCLSFLASALDRKGRPQTLLRALGVLSNTKEGDSSAWYAPTDDGRGVVINLERQQAVSMVVEEGSTVSIECQDFKVRNMQQHTNITNDSGISLRRRLTNAATMIVGGMRGGGGENGAGSDVLTTSPALESNDVTDAQNESLVTTITIECQKCGSDTRAEAGARAYVRGPVPLSIILCSNRLSSQREVDEVLVHELVHVYDVHSRQMDLRDCRQLAYSEVRAAREAECRNSLTSFTANMCSKDKATVATKNMFPDLGRKCVCDVFDKAIKDFAPLEGNDATTNNSVLNSVSFSNVYKKASASPDSARPSDR